MHVALPVAIGAGIYVLWRTQRLPVFDWLTWAGFSGVVEWLRQVAPAASALPDWVIFTLPDALWVYAVTACAALIWVDAPGTWARRFWLSGGLVMGAGSELGQAFGIVPGTFDPHDLVASVGAAGLAVWRLTRPTRHPTH